MLAQVIINTQKSHSLTQQFFFFTEDSCSAHPGQSPKLLHCICQSKFLMAQPCQHIAVQSLQQEKKYNSPFKSFHMDSVNMNFSKLWRQWKSTGRQRSLACYSPWGHKQSNITQQFNNMDVTHVTSVHIFFWPKNDLQPQLTSREPRSSTFFDAYFD